MSELVSQTTIHLKWEYLITAPLCASHCCSTTTKKNVAYFFELLQNDILMFSVWMLVLHKINCIKESIEIELNSNYVMSLELFKQNRGKKTGERSKGCPINCWQSVARNSLLSRPRPSCCVFIYQRNVYRQCATDCVGFQWVWQGGWGGG